MVAIEDTKRLSKYHEHEKVQEMLNGIHYSFLDAYIEIVQADDTLTNDFSRPNSKF